MIKISEIKSSSKITISIKVSEKMSVNKIKSLKLQRRNESANKLEETSILILEEEKTEKRSRHPETLTPVHSTPKRSSVKASGTQEQVENHMSPLLLPCTQDGGNEVAWDWQSPLAKSATCRRSKTNNENVGTPKRKTLLHKKRNSNSPLLYKPSKRKFMQNDNQQERVKIFTAEMKALSEQIKTVPKEEENRAERIETEEKSDGGEDDLLIDIDIEDFEECESKPAPENEAAKTLWKKPESPVGKTSLDELFDESIEDCMVKCSQEVEEKLRLECRSETSKSNSFGANDTLKDFSWHQHSYKSFVASKEKPNKTNQVLSLSRSAGGKNAETKSSDKSESVKSDRSKSTITESQKACCSSTKAAIEKCGNSSQSSRLNSNKETASVSRTNNKVETKEIETFEIPDDSFDEDFLDVCFDDVENTTTERTSGLNQSSNRYGKFYSSPHLNAPSDTGGPGKFVGTASRKLLLPPPGETAPTSNSRLKSDPKLFARTASSESFESRSTSVQQSQSSAANVSRKFFKTKSFSSSNFDDRSVDRSQFASTTTLANSVNSHTANGKNGKSIFCLKSSSVSTEQQQPQQQRQQQHDQHQRHTKSIDTFSHNAWPTTNGQHNNGITHFNRNASKDDGNRLNIINEAVQKPRNGVKDGATGSQLTQICTPEEIERKRREAKMKLEMKRKLQARSKSAGILTDFTTNKAPFKR